MKMKKVKLFIVEGPSDDTALDAVLTNYFCNNQVFVKILYRDITTDSDVTTSNILTKINTEILGYIKNNSLKKNDFEEVIHIIDTDGAFIPQTAIKLDKESKSFKYTTTAILSDDPNKVIKRNNKKSAILDKLYKTKIIGGIPYRVFYMSCNLDHVLYDKQNSTNTEKEEDSLLFAQRYRSDIKSFKKYITESDFSVTGDYLKSWEYIKKDLNSLNRHTNIGICL